MDNPNDFFDWLAVQPPFVEVALGAFFCLTVAPAVLASVAIAMTALEGIAETHLSPLFAFRPASSVSHSPHVPGGYASATARSFVPLSD